MSVPRPDTCTQTKEKSTPNPGVALGVEAPTADGVEAQTQKVRALKAANAPYAEVQVPIGEFVSLLMLLMLLMVMVMVLMLMVLMLMLLMLLMLMLMVLMLLMVSMLMQAAVDKLKALSGSCVCVCVCMCTIARVGVLRECV
jgi:hypothetical protein